MDAVSTILIADDDPIGRKLIETKLFGENYALVFANDGKEALEKTKQVVPDLILMDVMMPEMDGFAVTEKIKVDPLLRHIPIILVTALDSREDVMRGYSVGANDFLRKPVNSFELRARIRSMLSTKKQLSVLDTTVQLRDVLTRTITEAITPGVSSVLQLGQNLKQRAVQPLDVDETKQLVAQAKQLETLVGNLLLLVKTEGDNLILNRTSVNLNNMVKKVTDKLAGQAQAKQITLALDLPEKSRSLPLDAPLFQRALENLGAHTLEVSSPKSTVTFRLACPDAANTAAPIRLQVNDEGPVIPADQHLQIFEKAKSKTTDAATITVLSTGLPLCKHVIKAHGGKISVAPGEVTGNIFTIEL
jgi:CheY-like chemotaxis protein